MPKSTCSITNKHWDNIPSPPPDVDIYPRDNCNISTAYEIFEKYKKAYDNEMQGLCLIIADETQKVIGGEVVAGFLCMNGGQRSHWWIEKDGVVYDFMGDVYQKSEFNFYRKEEHRNREIFDSLLPKYEKYRLW